MARFYPTIDDNFHGSDGEIQVYQALQQLSDGYVVFHSFRWLGEPGQYRSEGEAILSFSTRPRASYPSKSNPAASAIRRAAGSRSTAGIRVKNESIP